MSRVKLRNLFLATAAAGALWLGPGVAPANAITVTQQTMVGGAGARQWSDDSAEVFVNLVGLSATVIDVGDRFRGILEVNGVENLFPPPTGSRPIGVPGVNELTGIFSFLVSSKSCVGAVCTFRFGPDSAFATEVSGLGFAGPATNAGVAFFEDLAPGDFVRTGTIPVGDASARNGVPYLLLGFDLVDDFVTATDTVGDDVAALAGLPPAFLFGTLNLGLSVLQNYTGMTFLAEACVDPGPLKVVTVDFCGNGTTTTKGLGDFLSWNDVNFVFTAKIPEPATLSIFGVGLLGMGLFGRRRKKKATS